MNDAVGDVGLFSRTKLYAQGNHRRVISTYWCLECEAIKLLLWKNLFVLEKCIWGQKYFCLPPQPDPCELFAALWNDPHMAGLVLCAPAWAGQSKPGQTEPCFVFLWKSSPRALLPYHSRSSRLELSALLSLGFAFSGKTHFTGSFCKCCFSSLFCLHGVLLTFLSTEIINFSIIMSKGGNWHNSESHCKFKIPYGCRQKSHHSLLPSLRQEPMVTLSQSCWVMIKALFFRKQSEQMAAWPSFWYKRDAPCFSAATVSLPWILSKQKWFLRVGKRAKRSLTKNSTCTKNAPFWNIIN